MALPAALTPTWSTVLDPSTNQALPQFTLPNPSAAIVVTMNYDFTGGGNCKRADGSSWPAVGSNLTCTALEAYGLVVGGSATYVSG